MDEATIDYSIIDRPFMAVIITIPAVIPASTHQTTELLFCRVFPRSARELILRNNGIKYEIQSQTRLGASCRLGQRRGANV
jgi:hypothetical protein